MTALFIVIPITLVLLAIAVGVFLWSVQSGQFDDLDSAAYLPVTDERTDKARGESSASRESPSPDKEDP